ncbi:DNA topoisomerase 1 [Massospora cicadina]|nr:DNA topoisomerase 1 [Massospora cicadina]
MEGSDSDAPLAFKKVHKVSNQTIDDSKGSFRKSPGSEVKTEDSDSDIPLALKVNHKISERAIAASKSPTMNSSGSEIKTEDSDSDIPLALKMNHKISEREITASKSPPVNSPGHKIKSEDSDSDIPLALKVHKPSRPVPTRSTSPPIKASSSIKSEASDSDIPLSKRSLALKSPAALKNSAKRKESASPKPEKKRKLSNAKAKRLSAKGDKGLAKLSASKLKSEIKKTSEEMEEDVEENEEYQWWLQEKEDDSIKWETLEHNGVLFPPDYVPHGIKMKYDGKPVALPPAAEEVAGFYAALLESDHAVNPIFQKNFFKDFLKVLKQCKADTPIKEFSRCDFQPMFEYFQAEKEKKKAMTKEEKLELKREKEAIEAKYGIALLDGRKEKVGNFRIEPPGLFRGRGEHPRTGCLKARVLPEQITINIGKGAQVPPPPPGHKWGKVVHDNRVTWLATWKENVNNQIKYVMFGATSSLKGLSDMKKFDKARELKTCVKSIRKTYLHELRDSNMRIRQRATAMYLIDRLALRAGNEKGEDEADTVGCCSLRYEHVTLVPPNTLHFDFLGKDSIRYVNDVEVITQVFKNIKLFKKAPKKEGDLIFHKLTTASLNKYLSSLMSGLTAKVFRTYNASYTFQEELEKTPADASVHEKILAYNRANRQVAILCNHQRSVSKGFEGQMMRIDDRIRALRYQRMRIRKQLLLLLPKLAKQQPELLEPEEDLTDEWCLEHIRDLMAKERQRAEAKFEKENLALKEQQEKPQPQSVLAERFALIQAEEEALCKEIKTGKVQPPKSTTTPEKQAAKLEKIDERIKVSLTSKIDKDENKTTALGTSKINYIDPRISAAWCDRFEVPLDKIFNRTLREKFKWAMEVKGNYVTPPSRFILTLYSVSSVTSPQLLTGPDTAKPAHTPPLNGWASPSPCPNHQL